MKWEKKTMNFINIYTVGLFWSLIFILGGVASWIYTGTLAGEAGQAFLVALGGVATVVVQRDYIRYVSWKHNNEAKEEN